MTMPNFIYVFSDEARDLLTAGGFALLKQDPAKSLYIFKNSPELCFDLKPGDFIYSDILTFN